MKRILLLPIIVIGSLVLSGCSIGSFDGLTAEEWADQASAYENRLISCREAVEEANSNIEDAQIYAGASYEEMEYALYNLSTIYEDF